MSRKEGKHDATIFASRGALALRIREFIWPADPQGVTHGRGDLHLCQRDPAKLGLLWLNGGIWDGKRIVAETWSRSATARNPLVFGGSAE